MGRQINNRMQWWSEKYGMVPNSQSGFRRGRFCIDNITNLTSYVHIGLMYKQYTAAAFLDVRAAFDSVQINVLLEKLAGMGVPINVLSFISNWSYSRLASFTSQEGMRIIYKGLPQGGVLSPLLYNIYVGNIFEGISDDTRISQYADDTALYCRNTSLEIARRSLERAVEEIRVNLSVIGLDLSPEKTEIVVFNNRNFRTGSIAFSIGDQTRHNSHAVKFLGVHLDAKLSYRAHIDKLYIQCSKTLNIIKFLRGVLWGCHPGTLLCIYKSLVRSRLEYASFIYFPNKQYLKKKLDSIQARAIKLGFGLRTSTPTNVVFAEAGVPFLQDRATFLGKT